MADLSMAYIMTGKTMQAAVFTRQEHPGNVFRTELCMTFTSAGDSTVCGA